jgi:hypothetical protein
MRLRVSANDEPWRRALGCAMDALEDAVIDELTNAATEK